MYDLKSVGEISISEYRIRKTVTMGDYTEEFEVRIPKDTTIGYVKEFALAIQNGFQDKNVVNDFYTTPKCDVGQIREAVEKNISKSLKNNGVRNC